MSVGLAIPGMVPLIRMPRVGGIVSFDFDPNLAAFVPGMAKRGGLDTFAAAPIVQGKWDGSGTPDVLYFPRGAQISGHYYANFDAYQGGGFCFWTPEQTSGDRNGTAYIWYVSSDYNFYYDYDNGRYALEVGGQTFTWVVAITAGTKETLAWGFDTNNKLDGTNYAYISRNNAQTFGITTQPTASAPDSFIVIGSNASTGPSSAIAEGLVFVREIPWTGAFGTDMGEGDIVAAHYAAGAGADVALSIGSWGTTYSMPTDSSTGALVTGTGEAWSHPHADAETNLTDAFCQTTYGASAWGDEGTPSTGPADLAAAEKIFLGGYKWTCDAANEGVTQTIAGLTAGKDYVLRVIAHCTSANDIRVRIWDETNGQQAINTVDFDFGASSSRTQPGVASFTFELPTIARSGAAADCVSISIKIMGTVNTQEVFLHQVELQDNLIDNPSLETGAGNPWIPDGWTNVGLDAGDTEAEAGTVHSGAGSMEWNIGASAEYIFQTATLAAGKYLAGGFWHYGDGTSYIRMQHTSGSAEMPFQYSLGAGFLLGATPASWSHAAAVWRLLTANPRLALRAYLNAVGDRFTDDNYAIVLDDVSITAVPASVANSTEAGGLRVDGRDGASQPILGVPPGNGIYRFLLTPRHDAADFMKFSGVLPLLAYMWGDANNWLILDANAANSIRLWVNAGGVAANAAWNCTGLIVAGTQYLFEIENLGATFRLLVDGVQRATISPGVPTTPFGTFYPGCSAGAGQQFDAVYTKP